MTYRSVKHDEIDTIDTIQTRESEFCYASRSLGRRIMEWCALRLMLRRSRIELMDLSEDQLRDIGFTRCDADKEARKVRFHIR
ncbi:MULTISPECIES: DUF1127 domain-containing protein [Brucella/Ochrobactrum group]|uniref:DUF1127 domain-containing protein n=1 Tax=Brucella/Ochrobactrum group TaxID=2826938 RepID=UPI0016560B3A|nr:MULTISPECIES: DUF1127 domain-containing protein [Brucella/Ochrobactrum group]MBC8717614.1 DUF1127 domain-containing protein [Ochrobactrum sp. Marseille-Q0166]